MSTSKKFCAVCCLFVFAVATVGAVSAGEQEKVADVPKCPVSGEDANLAKSFDTDLGPVYVCCKGCAKKVRRNSRQYAAKITAQHKTLAKLDRIQVSCPISGDPIDPAAYFEQDGKKVYACSKKCADEIKKNPGKYKQALLASYTYQTKCPVSGERIDPAASLKLTSGGSIHFCCKSCKKKFVADPTKYAKKLEEQHISADLASLEKKSSEG